MPRSNFYSLKNWLTALGYLAFVFLFPSDLFGQSQSLSCHSALQVSLDEYCEAIITGLTVVTGELDTDSPDDFLVTITEKDGGGIPASVYAGSGSSMMAMSNINVGEYVKFTEPGDFVVSIERKSTGITCWGYLYVENKLLPRPRECACPDTATVIADECKFSCVSIDLIYQNAAATDSAGLNPEFAKYCANNEEPLFWDELVEDTICGSWYIYRTWKVEVKNRHGATVSELNCIQKFLFEAVDGSSIHPPKAKVVVDCGVDTHPDSLLAYFSNTKLFPDSNKDSAVVCAYPYIIDSIPGYRIVLPPEDSIGQCLVEKDSTIKILKWHSDSLGLIFDSQSECGVADCKIIWIERDIIIKRYEECFFPGSGEGEVVSMTRFPIKPHLKPGSLNDRCKITATYKDTDRIPICGPDNDPSSYKFVRTWYIINWCTNETINDIHQVIKVVDTIPPSFTVQDTLPVLSTDPWSCVKSFKVPTPENMEDNCIPGHRIRWKAVIHFDYHYVEADESNGYTFTGLEPGEYDIIYKVFDDCDNESLKITKLIIEDHAKPIVITKNTIVVSFSEFNGDCTAKIFPYNIDVGSYDACDGDWVLRKIKRLTDTSYADFVKFTEDDITGASPLGVPFGEVKVELKITDKSGNYSIGWTTVRVEDKSSTIEIDCGDREIALECTDDLNEAIENYKPRVLLRACETRELEVRYEIVRNLINPKCNTGSVYVEYQLGGDSICTKQFHLGDVDTLHITWPAELVIASCSDDYFGEPIIDNKYCNLLGESVEIREFKLPEGTGYCKKIIREFTIIDWCLYQANSHDSTGYYRFNQVIKIKDDVRPVISCEEQVFPAGPGCRLSDFQVMASGEDGGDCASESLEWSARLDIDGDGLYEYELQPQVNPQINKVSVTIDTTLTAGIYYIWWKAVDECGNFDIKECSFTIKDQKAPTPVCIANVSTALMNSNGSVTIWARDFDPTGKSYDECGGPVYYSFSDSSPDVTSITFDCFDIANGVSEIKQLPLYVWDEAGNKSFCYVNLRLDDNVDICRNIEEGAAVISGSIWTEFGERLESAEVHLYAYEQNMENNDMTDISGDYAFFNAPEYLDYVISPSKNDDILNGVTTLDLLLIQRHILSISNLESPYRVIAADVNDDWSITALDLVQLRKLLLGITDDIENNTSWRFVDAGQQFHDIRDPWPLNEEINISELPDNIRNQDFIAVKVGDVNGSAIANSQMAQGRNGSGIELAVQDRELKPGEIARIELSFPEGIDLYGYQIELMADQGEILNIDANHNLENQNWNLSDGNARISWNSPGSSVNGSQLELSIRVNQQTMLSDVLSIGRGNFDSEIYQGEELERRHINLKFTGTEKGVGTIFAVYQNEPNPFTDNTGIGFEISEPGDVGLRVFDITGKQVIEQVEYYQAGLHKFVVGKELLGTSGVLYYQLSFKGNIATRKMISID